MTKNKMGNSRFTEILHNMDLKQNPYDGILYFKYGTKFTDLKKYIRRIYKNETYKDVICNCNTFPNKYKEVRAKFGNIVHGELNEELYWSASIISLFANEINMFVRLKNEFDMAILNSDYKKASSILEKVEKDLGVSLWLVESKIALLEQSEGLEKQKLFSNEIRNNEELEATFRVFAWYSSIRAEKNISHVKFNTLIEEFKAGFGNTNNFAVRYMEYKLNYYKGISEEDYIPVLAFEGISPIVDQYLTFIKICESIYINSTKINELEYMKNSIDLIKESVSDNSLQNLAIMIGNTINDISFQKSEEIIKIFDVYTEGNYEYCVNLCEKRMKNEYIEFEVAEVYVKCMIRLGRTSILTESHGMKDEIILNMINITVKSELSNEAYKSLMKFVLVFPNHIWSQQLYSYIDRTYSSNENYNTMELMGCFNKYNMNPSIGFYIKNRNIAVRYYNQLLHDFNNSVTVKLKYAIFYGNVELIQLLNISEDRKKVYIAEIFQNKRMFDKAIPIFNELAACKEGLTREDAIIGLTRCYIETNKLELCLNLLVDTYIANKYMYIKFPFRKILEKIEKKQFKECASNISLPIAYDIYSRNVSSDKIEIRADAYEDFLFAHGIDRASEINNISNLFDINKLIYFLYNVCIAEVLDCSTAFNDTESILTERMKICQILRGIDPSNEDKYLNEIRAITEKLMIKKAIREIDKSKIYVDVDGIKNATEINLKENFSRYKEYLSNKVHIGNLDYITVDTVDDYNFVVQIPKDEMTGLFNAMFFELRDYFVSSNEYGLDGNLSIGIRHGAISAKLRTPLEVAHLITQKDRYTNIYRENKYWKDMYYNYPEEILNKILSSLSVFAQEIDNLINEVKNKWIQINTEKEISDGLFNFVFTKDEFEKIVSMVNTDTTYEQFLDISFNKFWEKTDISLKIIRNKISGLLKNSFNNAFDRLQVELEVIKSEGDIRKIDVDLSELYNSISSARTTSQYNLDEVANWFRRSKVVENSNFNINFPMEIALEMISNIYPNANITTNFKVECDYIFKGKTLKSLVNVFFILFENVISKCNLSPLNPIVDIQVVTNDKNVTIEVKNNVSKTCNVNKENERLKLKKEELLKENSMEKIKLEGGTGFHKIRKIITFDLTCNHELDFHYNEDFTFTATISINAKEIIE